MDQIDISLPNVILVPQGAEYHAVRRGIASLSLSSRLPLVYPIPMGGEAVTGYLQQWIGEILPDRVSDAEHYRPKVLVLGLAGSLSPDYPLGDRVVYQQCYHLGETLECDRSLTEFLRLRLTPHTPAIRALTSTSIITQASEKKHLGQTYGASAVDMEGFAILKTLQSLDIPVGMVRVIGDRHNQDLPNLNATLNPQGQLDPLSLTLELLKHPLKAMNLIQGSLRVLPILSQIAIELYQYSSFLGDEVH